MLKKKKLLNLMKKEVEVAIVLLSLGVCFGLKAQTTDPDSNKVDNDGDGAPVPFSIRSLLLAGLVAIGFCFGLHAQANNPNKVDDDGNGLIEIWNLTDLNRIRNDLDGTHYNDGTNTPSNAGCPVIDHDNKVSTPKQATCHGYELMNDLNFTDKTATGYSADWDPVVQSKKRTPEAGWPPIGDGNDRTGTINSPVYPNAFAATFEGNGHTIVNLYVKLSISSRGENAYAGLFGFATGTLKNLGLTGEHMTVSSTSRHSRSHAGGLVGQIRSGVTITNCYATGDVSSSGSYSYAGGLVGDAYSGSTITNCHATGDVSSSGGQSYSGGLAGYTGGRIMNCYATGDVESSAGSGSRSRAGGLAGSVGSGGTITNCYAIGNVTSTASSDRRAYVGGISGDGAVTACYYSGVVKKAAKGADDATTQANVNNAEAIQTAGQYKTETQLKSQTAPGTNSGDLYYGWGTKNWGFGTSGQLPRLLSYKEDGSGNQVRGELLGGDQTADPDPSKVDDDGDGLIEIWNLSQLNNVRYNLAGTSYKNSASARGETTGCGSNRSAVRAAGGKRNKCHGYELMADLDFRNTQATGYNGAWVTGSGWIPIGVGPGTSSSVFSGTFEGNNRTISNLYVRSKLIFAGLFGRATGTLRNLGLTGEQMSVFISSDYSTYAGSLVGRADGGTITNCYATGMVTSISVAPSSAYSSSSSCAGGLVGQAGDNGTLTNCYATGVVASTIASSRVHTSLSNAGGLVGEVGSSSTLTNCYALGTVTSTSSSYAYAGGLVGLARDGSTVADCYATGAVTSTSSNTSYAGGLIGRTRENSTLTNCHATGDVVSSSSGPSRSSTSGGLVGNASGPITSCYATGAVSGKIAGGLVGYISADSRSANTITNCYASGAVSSPDFGSSPYAGGLVGWAGNHLSGRITIANCYATGSVTGYSARAYAGGLIGRSGTIASCYYSGVVKKGSRNNLSDVAQVEGQYKTETELKTPVSNTGIYASWSTSVWNFGTSTDLPVLIGVGVGATPPATPALAPKASSLSATGQVYTATFTGGTLYYLLREGAESVSVTKADVRGGVDSVGANKGSVAANAETKEISLSGLVAGTQYTLYVIVESGGGSQSEIEAVTFMTTGARLAVVSPGTSSDVWSASTVADGGDHDFGEVSRSGVPLTYLLKVKNVGTADLRARDWTASFASGSRFMVGTTSRITAGGQVSLTISFKRGVAPESSAVSDKLTLTSGGRSVSVDFSGQVVGAIFAVDPEGAAAEQTTEGPHNYDMGVVAKDSALEKTFSVKNTGHGASLTRLQSPTLTAGDHADFEVVTSVARGGQSIAAQASFSVTVRLKSTASIGRKTTLLTFTDGTATVKFNLSAMVQGTQLRVQDILNTANYHGSGATYNYVFPSTDYGTAKTATFTIENNGNVDLTGLTVAQVNGFGEGKHFSVTTDPNTQTIAKDGGTKALAVRFDGLSYTDETAKITIRGSSSAETITLNLTAKATGKHLAVEKLGTGEDAGDEVWATSSPADGGTHNFGEVGRSGTDLEETLTVKNVGNQDFSSSDWTATFPSGTTRFTVSDEVPIQAGNSIILTIGFVRDVPPEVSSVRAVLTLKNTAASRSVTVSFEGQVVGAVFAVDPESAAGEETTEGPHDYDMGMTAKGTTLSKTFVVKNKGTGSTLTLARPVLGGRDASDFEIVTAVSRDGQRISASGTFDVMVRLKSTSGIGSKSATVAFTDGTSTVKFNLSATVQGTQLRVQDVDTSNKYYVVGETYTYAFPSTTYGTARSADFKISNNGNIALTRLSVSALSGSGASHFSITDSPHGNSLPANRTATLTVSFDGSSYSNKTASLTLSGGTPGETVTLSLTAKATGGHLAVVSPGTSTDVWSTSSTAAAGDHDFGSVSRSTTPATYSLRVRNVGNANLRSRDWTASFASGTRFTVGATSNVVAGQSVALTVSFDRDVSPEHSAVTDKLTLTAGGHSVSLDFRGQVIGPVFTVSDPDATDGAGDNTHDYNIGEVSFGETLEKPFKVANDGVMTVLTLSAPTLGGTDASDFEIVTSFPVGGQRVGVGNTFIVLVRLKRTASVGNKSATLTFSDGTKTVVLTLSAVVHGSRLRVQDLDDASTYYGGGRAYDYIFPSTTYGAAKSVGFTIRNDGNLPLTDLSVSALSVTGVSHFSITENPDGGTVPASGGTATLTVSFDGRQLL